MQKAQLKLNLEKFVFRVSRGKVLGCLVSVKGIEANQDKIKAIVCMKPPQSRKEVQKLTGRIVVLNRFMAKIAEQSLGFFKVLRGSGTFEWSSEQQEAFDALKEYIQKLPTLVSPQPDQPLILYVSTTHTAVNRALVQERKISNGDKKMLHQVPIYFVSEALAGSKKYYLELEKICYAVVMSARKLRHYFEAHIVRVLTNKPLNNIFENHDSLSRIGKWAMELSEYVIDFEKRSAIKLQVLIDFIANWIETSSYTKGTIIETPWQVYCNGAWGVSGAGAVAILKSPSGIKLKYAARLQFKTEMDKCSNNIAEYEVVLLGLRKLRAMGVQHCILKTDSKVIASQIEKECIAGDETLETYLAAVQRMETFFRGFTVQYIERTKNLEANELVKAASKKTVIPPDVFYQVIEDPSMKTVKPEPRMVNVVQGEDWQALIMAYLHSHYEPDSSAELIRMQQRAKVYQVIGEEPYKTSIMGLLLRCLSTDEGKDLLA
jgi:ribonuclease HI